MACQDRSVKDEKPHALVRALVVAGASSENGLLHVSALDAERVVFFQGRLLQVGGMILSLFPREDLAKDAQISPEGSGFCGVDLAYNTRTKEEDDEILNQASKQERAC